MKSISILSILLVVITITVCTTAQASVIYVDNDASPGGNGSSWSDAYKYLRDALTAANTGDTILVGEGTYRPDEDNNNPTGSGSRYLSFQPKKGVELYGGYAGVGAPAPDERDIVLYETILSGDIDGNDGPDFLNYGENSYHVVKGSGSDSTTIVDGFTISGGNANVYPDNYGGGILWCNAKIRNCIITGNRAEGIGGGLYSCDGPITNCTINNNAAGDNGGGLVYCDDIISNCVIRDNVADDYGGGFYDCDGEIINCTISGNEAYRGGGLVYCNGSITGCTVTENQASYGSGFANSNATITGCTITGNYGEGFYSCAGVIVNCNISGNLDDGLYFCDAAITNCNIMGNNGRGLAYCDGTITNCAIVGNNGTGVFGCDGTISNCTISGNHDDFISGIAYCDGAISNCLVWANTGSDTQFGKNSTPTYSCIEDWSDGGEGNINGNPIFVRAYHPGPDGIAGTADDELGDLRLSFGSPCIDAGSNAALSSDIADLDDDGDTIEPVPFDLDGNPRVLNATVDMGAYEGGNQAILIGDNELVISEGAGLNFNVTLAADPGDTLTVTVAYHSGDTDITIDSGAVFVFDSLNYSTGQTVTLSAAEDDDMLAGWVIIRLTAEDVPYAQLIVWEEDNDVPGTIYVDPNASGAGNGKSWDNACNYLQDALAAAVPGSTILVADGTYKPDQGAGMTPGDRTTTFQLVNGVEMYGGYAGYGAPDPDARNIELYTTILSGDIGTTSDTADNCYHVVTGTGCDSATIIDGFTITAGRAFGSELLEYDRGGGIYNGSQTVSNCMIIGNQADRWGGGLEQCYGLIINSLVINNEAKIGGGLAWCNGTISDCTITGNSALGPGYGGGGLYNCDGQIINCTISENVSYEGGGGLFDCSGTITNCLISENLGWSYGGGLVFCGGTIKNNIIHGNTAYFKSGGGLYSCDGTIENNIITGNISRGNQGSSYAGGGLYNCNGIIRNNTICWNESRYPGGGLDDCGGTITNCIVWGNTYSGVPSQIYGSSLPSYSCIQDWSSGGEGNISDNPSLAYDGHLKMNSPCIDSGTDLNAPSFDIDEDTRPQGAGFDIGADEFLDSNGDGLPDWIEALGVIGINNDYDLDGMPNGWEYNIGLNPTIDDADSDADNDGITNYQEYLDGTDPLDPYSHTTFYRYVDDDAGTGGDGTSWASAFKYLQDALAAANYGDTICVARGVYVPDTNGLSYPRYATFQLIDGVKMYGGYAGVGSPTPDERNVEQYETILSGNIGTAGDTTDNCYHVITGSNCGSQTFIDGFIVTGGNANGSSTATKYGGGIYEGSQAIKNCAVRLNYAESGGGLYNCDGFISNCIVEDNQASKDGGGLYDCDGLIANCIIRGNEAVYNGGGLFSCSGEIVNSAVLRNSATEGGGLYDCDGTIRNSTIGENEALHYGGGFRLCNGTIINCVVWGNSAAVGPQLNSSSTPSYSCIQDWTGGGAGNINSDPLLAYDGYHITINSSCIDSGTAVDAPSDDIDGESRPQNYGVDMGADEFLDSDGDGLPDWWETEFGSDYLDDFDSDGMPNGWEYDIGLDPTIDDADSDADDDGFSNYQEYLDGTDPFDPYSRAAFYTYYVSPDGNDTYPYQSWEEASTTIQAAIDASHHGDTVLVAQGIYLEDISFSGKNILLTGIVPDSPSVMKNTIIDGSGSGPVISFSGDESESCVLTGFTIRNGGNSSYSGGGIMGYGCTALIKNNVIIGNVASSGAGLYLCHGTIEKNIIADNTASNYGSGIYYCNGTIRNNIITANSGKYGAGLASCNGMIEKNFIAGNSVTSYGGGFYTCGGTIKNNLIVGNFAYSRGGGLYNCDGTLMNNNVVYNSSNYQGGGSYSCNGAIVNCIVWGNTSPTGPQLYSSSTPTYSCIQDWTGGGAGNINNEPLFTGNPYDAWQWSADATYDSITSQTTFTDTSASWTVSLANMFVRPDTAAVLQYPIVSNTDTTIIVWGDLRDSVQAGDTYEIYDYHPASNSPCNDAGNSTVDAGEYDIDLNARCVNSLDTSIWDGAIKSIVKTGNGAIVITWMISDTRPIDMGAYEYQITHTVDTYTVQSRDALDTGMWYDIFAGRVGIWTDTGTAGIDKRFYRVSGE